MAAAPRPPAFRGRSSERETLERLLDGARVGRSGALVLRGEAGVGKTALLQHTAGAADGFRVLQVGGVESEMELPFAGLHQLCGPLLDELDALPAPQQDALQVSFGLASGAPRDRFLVGLATLTLLAHVADTQPLLCLVDDLQWLDEASAQVLGFVARRLLAEHVAMVFGVREPSEPRRLPGLPELWLKGLGHEDARALLATVVPGRLDDHVRERLIAETRGNPLALLELPRGMSAAELAGGFGRPGPAVLEDSFQRRLDSLPTATRRLLQLAAADPVGEPLLLWRAAGRLGIGPEAAGAAADAGLLEIGAQVRFRHPSVRSAAYRSATPEERQAVHFALAEATDAEHDPDRRAWHRAQATAAPDEHVAQELEHSAGRALARGGIAAAAAFLETAGTLTPEPEARARRLVAAARAKRDAGALDAALGLLVAIEAGPVSAFQAAEIEQLRGEIAFDQRRAGEAAERLSHAARQLDALDATRALTTHLKALGAGMWAGPGPLREASAAALAAPPAPDAPEPVRLLVDALATRVCEGYAAAAPALRAAVDAALALDVGDDVGRWLWLTGSRSGSIAAMELWDADGWHALVTRHVQVARDMGALVLLQFGLASLVRVRVLDGDLAGAAQAIEEVRAIAEATGTTPVLYTEMLLTAWRGQEALTLKLIERETREAQALGMGRVVQFADCEAAVLYNGLARYDAALEAARRAYTRGDLAYTPFVVGELAEAASRVGDEALVRAALARLEEHTPDPPGDWALGIDARVRALLGGEEAERWYLESIERLGRTRVRLELARSRLLYGEWLRREGRRVDAREQLRVAREAFLAMGAEGFVERTRRELLATGEKVRARRDDTRDDLTPQEQHIARLARDGLSNPEIGAELFLSPRTVEWHLKKVFSKLGISSRRALRDALPLTVDDGLARA
ncbi:regulatory LuxR family protein [Solirubrobacter pauli]|uniref:Regulatory LuxR family protein n=1 Tax=Solirubrobacter pauli TaxID=166793 RepID=A0A660KWN0_9ACTN|nr:LuxR family transcriptional regulator [Solirubrobacter pauli]RKQ84855.1 regulatory LuxR family protein [Solirubrobacter pauli]